MEFRRNKRKAISPVLATVILIAITLIAAIAIAGFVFGLFGSFTSVARVSASVTTCSYSGVNTYVTCTLSMDNTGTANTVAVACSMTYGGVTYTGTIGGTTTLTAGQTESTTCHNAAASPDPGAGVSIVGSVSASNGGSIPYTGTSSN